MFNHNLVVDHGVPAIEGGMNSKRITRYAALLFWLGLSAVSTNAQTNLLRNPNADEGAGYWRTYGQAKVEQTSDGNWRFVVRNGGHFWQDASLPEDSAGEYALLIGRASSERINSDGAITGLPYLYGYMMKGDPSLGRINSYLQGQRMRCEAVKPNQWVTVWGIFEVPPGTGAIRFSLDQAERKGVPQNGSAAWFDDLGLYLFSSEAEGNAFVQAYNQQSH
jgi:hypothetical protein